MMYLKNYNLKNKTAIVTGAGKGLGRACAIALAEAGAELAFTYLGDSLKKRVIPLAEKLNSKTTFSCDVEKKEDVIKLFENIKRN